MTTRDAGRYTHALQEPQASAPLAAERDRRRILVVDDLPEARLALAALLESIGHEVYTAADGEEAVELASRLKPDAVLLDLEMPRMDGFEACRRLRATPHGQDLLIVAVSAWSEPEDRMQGVECGFDLHLRKPADAQAIVAVIGALAG